MTDPADYAAWYRTPRGAWIGTTEFALLRRLVGLGARETVLDVGCGTGYFTTLFARETAGMVVGLDPNLVWLNYAARAAAPNLAWTGGKAEALPFRERSFDVVLSVTALCFIRDQVSALREMLRVCRRRFALGLLNRHSLLWRQKGRGEGVGAYRGAHWHTVSEVQALAGELDHAKIRWRTAVFFPGGSGTARWLEGRLPNWLPWGAFLAVVGDVQPK
jgi:SAM-dependent methyltransferase